MRMGLLPVSLSMGTVVHFFHGYNLAGATIPVTSIDSDVIAVSARVHLVMERHKAVQAVTVEGLLGELTGSPRCCVLVRATLAEIAWVWGGLSVRFCP